MKRTKKLLRTFAKANSIDVEGFTSRVNMDIVTGLVSNSVELYGSSSKGDDIRITAITTGEIKKIDRLIYSVDSGEVIFPNMCDTQEGIDGYSNRYHDVQINCKLDNAKQFLKSIDGDFKRLTIEPKDIDSFANSIDILPGIAAGESSTLVSLYGGEHTAFA